MEGAENMAIEALRLAMQDSPPSQKLKTSAFQARSGFCSKDCWAWGGGAGQVDKSGDCAKPMFFK